ncbi:MAG TPA: hypothetical protein VLA97_10055 [Nocardioidaceae bacterium]|nr:hypothetical protein [Nocardioidaceae bacterium]
MLLNIAITGTSSTSEGSLIAFRADSVRPSVTNLRIRADAVPENNTALVEVSSDDRFSIYTSTGATSIIVDVEGYVPDSTGTTSTTVRALDPKRLYDSRTDSAGPLEPTEYRDVTIAGTGGVPSGVTAIFANITVLGATGDGYIKAMAGSQAASSVAPTARYSPTGNDATGVLVPLDADGVLRLYNYVGGSDVDVVVDVQAYVTSPTSTSDNTFHPAVSRVYDSRSDSALASGAERAIPLGGTLGIPVDRSVPVVVNLTVLQPGGPGYVRIWNADFEEPVTSNINFRAGESTSNLSIVETNPEGDIVVSNHSDSALNFVLDSQAWFTPPPLDVEIPPIEETREDVIVPEDAEVVATEISNMGAEAEPMTAQMNEIEESWTVLAEGPDGSLTPLNSEDDVDPSMSLMSAQSAGTWWDGVCTNGESKYEIIKLWPRQKFPGMSGSEAKMYCGKVSKPKDDNESRFGIRHIRRGHKEQFVTLAAYEGSSWGTLMTKVGTKTLSDPWQVGRRVSDGHWCYEKRFSFKINSREYERRTFVVILGKTGQRIMTLFPKIYSPIAGSYCYTHHFN